MELLEQQRLFAGRQQRYRHYSESCSCDMVFSVFLPPQAEQEKVPVLYFLSGLTCSDENFSTKSGAQRLAAELGLALVIPDTSPRGNGVADDPEGAWDFGLGAGFYLNARQAPWRDHYRMYDYVCSELPALVESRLPLDSRRRAISGHSMGGHGALVLGLRNPSAYQSISAFAPIVAPMDVPWGQKAFSGYLGDDRALWQRYDACRLLASSGCPVPMLIDQGEADSFLQEQLQVWRFQAIADKNKDIRLSLRMQPGYDHSYFFIASFIEDHLRFHWRHLTSEV